ncbi:MAG: formate dehydrogenase subunit alpha [Candidatus Thiodiazotropha lotti]|uniref:Formate dehydrogenase subunit alpha n=1 Tax=Candidatus Thiodiazotropha lotti TaxID=2792787 RepID=A0A9E4N1C3_9GAMM|nr:formate dehydrogenase subunit alpha [Candidatus Thiodiazotropha lotti]ODB99789.1 formate dehydrogenase [Candidatus Thiodiazotropha endoloripes]MCG7921453.1 formate dehydrogenase subunit alpha [Candidatus Thiodiazotropha lotti]MCG7941402.1 formate dehydrogenase subunit alpha [Candidatus Thiodiazotropha lotti]MCG8002212.1 formate dehydrogenase subunit alpha [Candidatus Thiodiazotropha lotti]
MKLHKISDSVTELNKAQAPSKQSAAGKTMSRRSFLRNSGLMAGGAALATGFTPGMIKRAEAATDTAGGQVELKKTICTHCSVGCGIIAEVHNGVWTGQEPAFDHPFNLGAHCAKGASVREHGHGERRLKYPTKLVDGKWKRVSWEQAINEIGDKMLEIREQSGPDSVYWLGSAKHNNEQAYLFRKFAAFWGTNNVDHQARICHSTTVAGVANTWGYGAMTNSYNDIHNSQAILIIGGNPAEAHPVSLQHVFKAKEENNAPLIVIDPRFTRTAAHADLFLRLRPGTDVPLIWGMLYHIFKNGWEDKTFIRQRVYGLEEVKKEVAKWTPDEVERVTGVPENQVYAAAKTMSDNRPGTFIWCMGGTQHTIGNNNTRAYCAFQLALGNMGVSGGGTNIFRGHDNVQGATDFGVLSHTLPGYYGLSKGAWGHWSKVWDVDYDYIAGRFDQGSYEQSKGKDVPVMNTKGIPVSRWIDGVLEEKGNIAQKDNVRAMVLWGHAPNSQTRGPEMKKAMEKLDMMVIVDPYPTVSAVMHDRTDGVYLLPAATQFETYGSVTASNRSLQWRDKVIEPMFESLPDHTIMYRMANKLGFANELFKNIKVTNDEPLIEDITREFNRGMWTIGYTGQSPERMKKQQQNWGTFDYTSLLAEGGPCDGEFYGLPWPCWGTAEMGHPGTPNLYDTSKSVANGGLTFRARFGVERNGVSLLADGAYSRGSEIKDGYPEFTDKLLKKLGWWNDLTPEEQALAEGKNWKTDRSGGIQRVAIKHGCAPFGNAKARTVVWTFPDPVPIHREPLYTSRRDLVEKYPTYEDRKSFYRLPVRYGSIQAKDYSKDYPIILTSGRLVEYEGGGDETRSNAWLAELQQDMFVEMHPRDANNAGVKDGDDVWLEGAEGAKIKVKAMVTRRVGSGVAFMPFHFGGHFLGKDLRDKYPEGADPYVLGEACNTAMTYGYDSVTQMQETKCSLCRITKA